MGAIEIVIGTSIALAALLSLLGAANAHLAAIAATTPALKAGYLLEEGLEAARTIRDRGWQDIGTLAIDTPHYLAFESSAWAATATPALIDGAFDRTVTLGSVRRDASGDIAAAGTIDAKARLVTVSVSWLRKGATTTRTLSGYLHDLQ